MKKERIYMLDILKIIAILLVFNSHCDNLYNNAIYATGGALGNALFFIVCGYLIKIDGTFFTWFLKKIKRLYIPMIVVTAISCMVTKVIPTSFFDFFKMFIWPTNYWFVGALIIFYVLIYFLQRTNLIKNISFITIITIIIYFSYYFILIDTSVWSVEATGLLSVAGLFKLVYYFYIFTLGYYMNVNNYNIDRKKILFITIIILLFSYFGFKYLLYRNVVPMIWQFIVQILGIVFAVSCLLFALNLEKSYKLKIRNGISKIVIYLSNISFEIYLCQFIIIKLCEKIIFPLNIISSLICTIAIAAVLYKVENTFIIKKQEVKS